MKAIYKFFRSVKLAIVLLIIIIVFAILSTLVEQGKGEDFYRRAYQPALANLVLASGIANFSSSLIFLVPMGMFIISLGVCTVDRLVNRARQGVARRYGPDLIHISLLVLCVGALVTTSLRKEQYFTMGPGDAVALPGGYQMSLVAFDFQKYDDGRPKAWISTVDVTLNDKKVRSGYAIEVNHPLGMGLLKVYQTSFGNELSLAGPDGTVSSMSSGQGLPNGDTELYFADTRRIGDGPNDLVAVIEEWKGQAKVNTREGKAGDRFGPYTITALRQVTGLTAVRDPGFIPVLVALIIGTFGMALTTLQKKGKQI